MAKNPRHRPADATLLVGELDTIASGACGQDWHERGRSHLGEAALLLAMLWPSGTPPAVQGTEIYRIRLFRRFSLARTVLTAALAVALPAAVPAPLVAVPEADPVLADPDPVHLDPGDRRPAGLTGPGFAA